MEVKDFYNNISLNYDDLRYGSVYSKKVAELENAFILNYLPDGKCLEIGAGTGRVTKAIVEKCRSVLAIDVSPEMVKKLRQNIATTNNNFKSKNLNVYNLASLDDYGTFDSVVSLRMLSHIENPLEVLRIMSKSVKPGGIIIFDLWNSWGYSAILKKLRLKNTAVYTNYMSLSDMKKIINSSELNLLKAKGFGYVPSKASLFFEGNSLLIRFAQRILWVCKS